MAKITVKSLLAEREEIANRVANRERLITEQFTPKIEQEILPLINVFIKGFSIANSLVKYIKRTN